MSTLRALARVIAAERQFAQPVCTVRHVHISDRPLVIIPLALSREACAPLAAMVGDEPDDAPQLLLPGPAAVAFTRLLGRSTLCGPSARRWRSWTPYLPVRHRKRETLDEYVATDVAAELRYRGLPPAAVSRAEPGTAMTDRWTSEFRRHRINERRVRSRPGMGLRLQFAESVEGPLLLGQLSHFGFGIFVPVE